MFLGQIYVDKCWAYTVASAPVVIGSVFIQRFRFRDSTNCIICTLYNSFADPGLTGQRCTVPKDALSQKMHCPKSNLNLRGKKPELATAGAIVYFRLMFTLLAQKPDIQVYRFFTNRDSIGFFLLSFFFRDSDFFWGQCGMGSDPALYLQIRKMTRFFLNNFPTQKLMKFYSICCQSFFVKLD